MADQARTREELSKLTVKRLREAMLGAGWDEAAQGKLYKLRKAQLPTTRSC